MIHRTRPAPRVAALLGCAALAAAAIPVAAQQNTPPCTAPEHSQFDFWLGSWDVSANGQKAGTNTIEKDMGGCVLHESYESVSGYVGESFNVYDAARGVWHQSWVDNSGLLLLLEGTFHDGAMVLEGQTTATDGTVSQQRITWSVVDGDPDRVRQLWESKAPDSDWTVAFDGLYERTSN